MSDLVFYGNISSNALNASNGELVSKGQSDTNSCSYDLSGISSWSAGALSNALGQLRLYNGLIYSCNRESLTASQGATTPDQSQYWDVCTFSQSATSTTAGLVKIGSGLSVSGGKISALASRKRQKTISNSTISLSDGYSVYKFTPSSDAVFAFSAPEMSDCMQTFDLVVTFGSTVYNLAFPESLKWGYCPSEYEANTTYIFRFSTFDSGETWYGVCLNGPKSDPNKNSIIFIVTVPANTLVDLYNEYDGLTLLSPITADWGDGTTEELTTGTIQHTYTSAGTYQIRFKSTDGKMPILGFSYLEGLLDSIDYADVEWYCNSNFGTNLISVEYMFWGCENLVSVPGSLFSRNNNIGSFESCFQRCGLESIPSGLFGGNTQAQLFNQCFSDCSNIESIPSNLFDGFVSVTSFSSCFGNCSSLLSIPTGLFDDCASVQDFAGCFGGCSSLTVIPSGLFDACTNVTSFSGCFDGTAISEIPASLFVYNRQVTNFSSCFSSCGDLTIIPNGLFNTNSSANNFNACFSGCTNLTTVPVNLFANITQADFRACFKNCSSFVPNVSPPYVPQIWEKDTDTTHDAVLYSYLNASASARQYVPNQWGGTISGFNPLTMYSKGDWVWYTFNGVPKVYTYINETSANNQYPGLSTDYWVEGYLVPADVFVTFSKPQSGTSLVATTINYKGTEFTYSQAPAWTYGSFDSATWNALWQQADSFMMSNLSLTNGVLTLTMGDGANVYPLDNLAKGDVLTFGGFTESDDGSYWHATSSTYTKS